MKIHDGAVATGDGFECRNSKPGLRFVLEGDKTILVYVHCVCVTYVCMYAVRVCVCVCVCVL